MKIVSKPKLFAKKTVYKLKKYKKKRLKREKKKEKS